MNFPSYSVLLPSWLLRFDYTAVYGCVSLSLSISYVSSMYRSRWLKRTRSSGEGKCLFQNPNLQFPLSPQHNAPSRTEVSSLLPKLATSFDFMRTQIHIKNKCDAPGFLPYHNRFCCTFVEIILTLTDFQTMMEPDTQR